MYKSTAINFTNGMIMPKKMRAAGAKKCARPA